MNIILKIRRSNPKSTAIWEEFEVSCKPGMTVASALRAIERRPINRDGKASTPVLWDSQCHTGSCGVCTMLINGQVRPACETFVKDLDQPVALEPLSKFKVLRDLVVDRQPKDSAQALSFTRRLDGFYPLSVPLLPRRQADELVRALRRCVECQACVEACPQYSSTLEFTGAVSLAKGYELHLQKQSTPELFLSKSGALGCDNTQNCVRVCPEQIPLTQMIGGLKRQSIKVFFKQWVG